MSNKLVFSGSMVSFLCVGVCVGSAPTAACTIWMSKAFLLSCIQIPSSSSLSETQVWHVLQFPFCRLGACVGSHWSMHNLEWEKLRLSPQTKFFKHCHILNSGLACSTRRWFLLACISHFKVMISSSLPISFLFWFSSCSKNTLSEKTMDYILLIRQKIWQLVSSLN